MNSNSLQARRQRGGTLIGFILGLLVGLAGALSVAIYVTRVPVPFVDRGVSRKPAQDEAEAERNRGWNPNAALGSREMPGTAPPPPPPAAEEAGTIVVPPADGKALPVPTPSPTPDTPVARPVTPGSTDPLGDLVQSRLGQGGAAAPAAGATPSPAAGPGADPFNYFVQAGAFRTPEDAETQRAKLAMLGIAADVSEREQSGRTVFRVRVGPFTQKALADATREQLESNGVEAALVRVQR
ncbi:MAG: SPOR domain-containing protein [Hydrogenophaga sp.]|nr:SPOR domain-containing protein [Hydrogenophaga sp.]